MKLGTIITSELQKSKRGLLTFYGIVLALLTLIISIFSEELFGQYDELLESFPPEILEAFGIESLGSFDGFVSVYIFEFAWMWMGIYLVIISSQSIPTDIQTKTIDMILSKPIKRYEYVLGKLFHLYVGVLGCGLIAFLSTLIGAVISPDGNLGELGIGNLLLAVLVLVLVLSSLVAAAFFFSTFVAQRRALAAGFGVLIIFYFISSFSSLFRGAEFIKWISPFTYFEPGDYLAGELSALAYQIPVLIGINGLFIGLSIVFFGKRDIPV